MILSLEILQAKEGDCLILHYGSENDPQIMVIDGGPTGVYKDYLKPRLLQIKGKWFPDSPLPLSMVMVSHADDDHINGIVQLTNNLVQQKNDQEDPLFEIDKFWFNSFDDIIGNIQIPLLSNVSSSVAVASQELGLSETLVGEKEHITAVIVSTGQGRTIRDNAVTLGLSINDPFTALPNGNAKLVRGDSPNSKSNLIDQFTIQVVHPNEHRLIELQKKWDEDLKKTKPSDKASVISALYNTDKSPFNLSSIVCLIEHAGKKILITGDGRSDDILAGLTASNLLDANGKLHVDILKMPHHGSKANMDANFLQKITADHYVISADGKHDNPDQEVLDLFEQHVKTGILHLTNYKGKGKPKLEIKLDAFISSLQNAGSQLKIQFPPTGKKSSIIDLLKAVKY